MALLVGSATVPAGWAVFLLGPPGTGRPAGADGARAHRRRGGPVGVRVVVRRAEPTASPTALATEELTRTASVNVLTGCAAAMALSAESWWRAAHPDWWVVAAALGLAAIGIWAASGTDLVFRTRRLERLRADAACIVSIDPALPTPVHEQLVTQVIAAIDRGTVRPGDRLPTVRQLAADLGAAWNGRPYRARGRRLDRHPWSLRVHRRRPTSRRRPGRGAGRRSGAGEGLPGRWPDHRGSPRALEVALVGGADVDAPRRGPRASPRGEG